MNIQIDLSPSSIDRAIRELEAYKRSLEEKGRRICERLAIRGAMIATAGYNTAIYDGPKDVEVSVEETPEGYKILADGETVLLLEFGAGIRYGDGHPLNGAFGMGPGTYPDGKGHWDDPKGWWLPKSAGGGHSYGNSPSMTMYETGKTLREQIEEVAREVFAE